MSAATGKALPRGEAAPRSVGERSLLQRLGRVASLPLYEQANLAELAWQRAKGHFFYRRVFGSFGNGSVLYPPTMIANPRFMHIGDRVMIRKGARLEAVLLDPDNPPEIRIGNDVNIEQDVHIVAIGKIHIHDKISIAPRSTLLCSTHPFLDVDDPVKIGDRLEGAGSYIEIGEGSLLGVGSVVLMNVRIGRRVVVGSNSTVKKDVADDCVVAGSPAAVVRWYDREEGRWRRPAKQQ
jgi:acetyltransferase-like isoleucine patch superfamily enzyme